MTRCKIGKVRMKNGGAPVYLISSQPNSKSDTVLRLEEALEMARCGNLLEFCLVGALKNDLITTTYTDGMKAYAYAGISGCEILKKRLLETLK